MKITALVENKGNGIVKGVHGLSLYIETEKHKLLVDLGPDETLFANAVALGVDLAAVDTIILSHGHDDHGGALRAFLAQNTRAKVYVQRAAFEPIYFKFGPAKVKIGLEPALAEHPQIVRLDGDAVIDEELSLFVVTGEEKCHSTANDTLYDARGRDRFLHEQNLIIREGEKTALVLGCGHKGVVNILERAGVQPGLCVGGYHLYNPTAKKTVPEALLAEIAGELARYPDTEFYTCHCTGEEAFCYLAARLPRMHYLAAGDSIEY